MKWNETKKAGFLGAMMAPMAAPLITTSLLYF